MRLELPGGNLRSLASSRMFAYSSLDCAEHLPPRKLDPELREQTLIAEVEKRDGGGEGTRVRMNWTDNFRDFHEASDWLKPPLGSKLWFLLPITNQDLIVFIRSYSLGSFLGVDNQTGYQWIRRNRKLQVSPLFQNPIFWKYNSNNSTAF